MHIFFTSDHIYIKTHDTLKSIAIPRGVISATHGIIHDNKMLSYTIQNNVSRNMYSINDIYVYTPLQTHEIAVMQYNDQENIDDIIARHLKIRLLDSSVYYSQDEDKIFATCINNEIINQYKKVLSGIFRNSKIHHGSHIDTIAQSTPNTLLVLPNVNLNTVLLTYRNNPVFIASATKDIKYIGKAIDEAKDAGLKLNINVPINMVSIENAKQFYTQILK